MSFLALRTAISVTLPVRLFICFINPYSALRYYFYQTLPVCISFLISHLFISGQVSYFMLSSVKVPAGTPCLTHHNNRFGNGTQIHRTIRLAPLGNLGLHTKSYYHHTEPYITSILGNTRPRNKIIRGLHICSRMNNLSSQKGLTGCIGKDRRAIFDIRIIHLWCTP